MDSLDILELEAEEVNAGLPDLIGRFKSHGLNMSISAEADMDTDAELRVVGRADLLVQVTLDGAFVVRRAEGMGPDFTLNELGTFRSVTMAADAIWRAIRKG